MSFAQQTTSNTAENGILSSPGSGVLDNMLNVASLPSTSKPDNPSQLNDQDNDKDDLSAKVNLLMNMMNEIAPAVKALTQDAGDEDVNLDSDTEQPDDGEKVDEVDEPSNKRAKTAPGSSDTSTVDSLVTEVTEDEPTGPAISEKIAKVLDNILSSGLNEQVVKRRKESILRPSNTKLLAQTRVNTEIWDIASKPTRSMDARLQALQDTLVKGLIPLANVMGKVGESIDNKGDLPTKEVLWEHLSNSLLLIAEANHNLNICRRDMFKSDLDDKYKVLCNNKKSVGLELFGDDLAERLKTVTESNNAAKKLTKTKAPSKKVSKPFLSQGGRNKRPYASYNSQATHQGRYQKNNRYLPKEPQKTTHKSQGQTAKQP